MKNQTTRSQKKAWNPILVLVLFLCAICGLVALTYSWLTDSDGVAPTDENDVSYSNAEIGNFSYTVEYSFDNGSTWNSASTVGQYGVDVDYRHLEPGDAVPANHISKLSFRVKQNGDMKSAVRVKFFYQWFNSEDSSAAAGERRSAQGPVVTLTPVLGSNSPWQTSQSADGFYYYYANNSYVFPRRSNGNDAYVTICNGFTVSPDPIYADAQLRVVAFVDGVQFNRYREVWEVSTIPPNN